MLDAVSNQLMDNEPRASIPSVPLSTAQNAGDETADDETADDETVPMTKTKRFRGRARRTTSHKSLEEKKHRVSPLSKNKSILSTFCSIKFVNM